MSRFGTKCRILAPHSASLSPGWGCLIKAMKTKRIGPVALVMFGLFTCQPAQAFYNPSTGRWLSRDPIGEKGGENLLAFVKNNAINKQDYLGQSGIPGCGGLSPAQCPANNISPAPKGPFSKCRIALNCGPAALGTIHCGLVVDVGSAVYSIDGTGGSINTRCVTPGSTNAPGTGPFTDVNSSYCNCMFASIEPWNASHIPRDHLQNNSNWNLKCLITKCGLQVNWGGQQPPVGYNSRYCLRWGPPQSSIGACGCPHCEQWGNCP